MNAITRTAAERAAKLKGLGTARKRIEDVRFTRGKGTDVDDIVLPGMLRGDFVRWPHAHAHVVSVNKEVALATSGVSAVLTAENLAPLWLHRMPTSGGDEQMMLAHGKVLFQGQQVALVVALDRDIAADTVEQVEVEQEDLPVVVDPFEALEPDAPVLREDLAGKTEGAQGPRRHHNHSFICEQGVQAATEAVLAEAAVVVEEMIDYHRSHPLSARNLRLRRLDGRGDEQADDLGDVPDAARRAHHGLADLRLCRAQYPRDLARHRRWLRYPRGLSRGRRRPYQQGAGRCGLSLLVPRGRARAPAGAASSMPRFDVFEEITRLRAAGARFAGATVEARSTRAEPVGLDLRGVAPEEIASVAGIVSRRAHRRVRDAAAGSRCRTD